MNARASTALLTGGFFKLAIWISIKEIFKSLFFLHLTMKNADIYIPSIAQMENR